jgi:hypothetical protein
MIEYFGFGQIRSLWQFSRYKTALLILTVKGSVIGLETARKVDRG